LLPGAVHSKHTTKQHHHHQTTPNTTTTTKQQHQPPREGRKRPSQRPNKQASKQGSLRKTTRTGGAALRGAVPVTESLTNAHRIHGRRDDDGHGGTHTVVGWIVPIAGFDDAPPKNKRGAALWSDRSDP